MNRGVDRQPIFFDDADRVEFGQRLSEIHHRFEVSTLAYCLMTNHFHLVVKAPLPAVSAAMHHLGTTFVRRTNDRVGRDGPMFRSRYVALPVLDDRYLATVVRYVHRNALDLPGIADPTKFRWSSLRAYLGFRRRPDFLDTSTVLALFDDDASRFAAFHTETTDRCAADLLRPTVERELAAAHLSPVAASSKAVPRSSVVFGCLLDHPDEHVRDAAVAALGHPSDDALRMARLRASRRGRTDPALAAIVARVSAELTAHRPAA